MFSPPLVNRGSPWRSANISNAVLEPAIAPNQTSTKQPLFPKVASGSVIILDWLMLQLATRSFRVLKMKFESIIRSAQQRPYLRQRDISEILNNIGKTDGSKGSLQKERGEKHT